MISAIFDCTQFLPKGKNKRAVEQNIKVCSKKTRINAGRKESPSYAIIDSQSVKTTLASEERGIDGGKKQVLQKYIERLVKESK